MGGERITMDYTNLFVCLMGICTVFIGLICIIFLVSVMSYICTKTDRAVGKKAPVSAAGLQSAPAASAVSAVTPELIAAVSAAIAEEMGADVGAIRIVSMKKL